VLEREHNRVVAAVLTIAIAASAASLWATRHDPLVVPDSALYVGAARNALDGRGLTSPVTTSTSTYAPAQAAGFDGAVPLTSVPPLLPVVLTVEGLLGFDPVDWARLALAACLAGNLILAATLTLRLSRAWPPSIAVVTLLVAGPGISVPPHTV
jgi:hypothetical protein